MGEEGVGGEALQPGICIVPPETFEFSVLVTPHAARNADALTMPAALRNSRRERYILSDVISWEGIKEGL